MDRGKRLLIGRALRTETADGSDLRKRRAIPAFASDALSSNVYATQEILLVLAVGGASALVYGPWVAAAVAVVFFVVVAAYRRVVVQYPGGGGDYEVAKVNLGSRAGAMAAAAMLVDFSLTLAVSVSAAVATLGSAFPALAPYRVLLAVALILLLALISLRGVRDSHRVFVAGTYLFVAVIVGVTAVAALQVLTGHPPQAQSASWTITGSSDLAGLGLVLVLTRAFSSGGIAITGVESIGTAVPRFRRPRGDNAATALVALGVVSMTLFGCLTWLAQTTGVKVTENDADLIGLPSGQTQQTVVVQIAEAVVGDWRALVWLVVAATVLILAAAATSSFRSFSTLASLLARDGYLPKQLLTRGDRLVFSNGILVLSVAAIVTIVGFGANLASLIQLYIIGVFLSLTLGQLGMARHWAAVIARPTGAAQRRRARRSRWMALLGSALTSVVLVVALLGKFTGGAWMAVLAIGVLFWLMTSIRRHYVGLAEELAAEDDWGRARPPAKVNAIILVGRVHKSTLRAIAFARATRPQTIEAITVAADRDEADAVTREWLERDMPVPLVVLDSPYRAVNAPVTEYVLERQAADPDALITIYVPEYLLTRWWERFLHNQTAARLKRRMMSFRNVTVVSVPWQVLSGSGDAADDGARVG